MKAILLDRDDTLNEDPGYINDPSILQLKPGVVEGLSLLRDAGYRFFVLTNQSGVSRGLISPSQLAAVHERLAGMLEEKGIHIEKFYVCPHQDSDGCTCRKPAPGMFEQFFAEYRAEPSACYAIGDKIRDIRAAGSVPGVLLCEKKTVAQQDHPHNLQYCARDMLDAARYILKHTGE